MSQLFPMNMIETMFPSKTVEDVRPKLVREEKSSKANADSESFGRVLEKVDKKEAAQSSQSTEGAEAVAKENNKDDRRNGASLETVDTALESEETPLEIEGTPSQHVVLPFEIVDIPLEKGDSTLETIVPPLETDHLETDHSKLGTVDAAWVANHGNEVNRSVSIQSSEAIVHTGEAGNKTNENASLSDKGAHLETGLGKPLGTPVSNNVVLGEDKNISQEKGMTTSFENTGMKGLVRQESNAKIPLEEMSLKADDSEERIEIRPLDDAEKTNFSMKESKELPKGESKSKSADEHSMKLNREKSILDMENELTGPGTELEDGLLQKEKFSSGQNFIRTSSSDMTAIQESTAFSRLENRPSLNLPDKIVSQVTEQFKILQPGGIERVRFQLEPKTLGSLQIEITVQKGAVVAHIVTADVLVKELLEGSQDLLRQNLAEQGFRIDKFSVDVGEMGASFNDKREDLQFMRHRHPFPQVGESEALQLGASQISKRMGLINLYV